MESILGKILASALICAATGGDPEVESKKCAEEIMQNLFGEEKNEKTSDTHVDNFASIIASMPMCVRAEHKAGSDDNELEIQAEGHPVAMVVGITELLKVVGTQVAIKQNKGAAEVIREICNHAICNINRGGI